MNAASNRTYIVSSGVIFGIVAVVHLLRAVNAWTFEIGPVSVPVGVSWVGFAVTAALCAWALSLATAKSDS
jgi:hypothetical protein